MATARHDRRGRGFQGALLVSALIPLALAAEPEVPLRFGDPESALLEDAETTQAHPSDVLDDSEVSEKVTETFADPADRVRAVLASIPKGSPFPEQLDQMASMGPAAVPALQSALSDSGGQWELRWASAMALGRITGKA